MIQNIPSQIPQKQCYQIPPWKELCKSVRWIHNSQRSFLESFFLVFVWGYLLCHYKLQCTPKYPIADCTKRMLTTAQWKEWWNLWDENTSQNSFSKSFSIVFIWGYLLFHYRLQCAPIYPFADSTKTVLSSSSVKRMVYLCEVNSHITK